MNITLNNYKIRALEINNSLPNNSNCNYINKECFDKECFDKEYKQMISYLQGTLNEVLVKYEEFKSIAKLDQQDQSENIDAILNNAPNTNVSWISELNQWSIKINGIVLRGNIGNIYSRRIIDSSKISANHIIPCKMGNDCYTILSESTRGCKFYHDPLDLIKLREQGKISSEYYNLCKLNKRNFSNISWLYTDSFKNNKNKYMRSFGSYDSLKYDINFMKISLDDRIKDDIETLKDQIMHDILVLIELQKNNLII